MDTNASPRSHRRPAHRGSGAVVKARRPVVLVLWAKPGLQELVVEAIEDEASIVASAEPKEDLDRLLRIAGAAVVVVESAEQANRVLASPDAADAQVVWIYAGEQRLHVLRLAGAVEEAGPDAVADLRALLVDFVTAAAPTDVTAPLRK
jgi:hypothetical protein